MANELITKVKAEIERRITDNTFGAKFELIDILAWLDTLESENTVPADLEKASDEYAEKHGFRVPYDGSDNFYDDVDVKASKEGFINGSKWQKEQDEKEQADLFTIVALDAAQRAKEQMMKGAVEGEVRKDGTVGYFEFSNEQQFHSLLEQFQDCDKVRIIVVKED